MAIKLNKEVTVSSRQNTPYGKMTITETKVIDVVVLVDTVETSSRDKATATLLFSGDTKGVSYFEFDYIYNSTENYIKQAYDAIMKHPDWEGAFRLDL